jgi:hypothetical protein
MPKHDDADMRAGAQFPIDLTDEVPSLSRAAVLGGYELGMCL